MPLARNIIDFMGEVGGGAVLVTITAPSGRARYPKFEIRRIANGPSISRSHGWIVPDYPGENQGMSLQAVAGRIVTNAQLEADREATKTRRAAALRIAADNRRRTTQKKAPAGRRAKKGA